MRYAFHFVIRPGKEKEYEERHRAVWPDLLNVMKQAGVRNYSIFIDGREVFGFWECENVDESLEMINKSPVNTKWQKFMSDVIETPMKERNNRSLKEAFRLD